MDLGGSLRGWAFLSARRFGSVTQKVSLDSWAHVLSPYFISSMPHDAACSTERRDFFWQMKSALERLIEAGLVIQSLLAANPGLRVLVVTPGTTSRQWLSELYSRFGGRVFTHIDAVRYASGGEPQKTLEALLHSDRLIVTTSLLRTRAKVLAMVTERTRGTCLWLMKGTISRTGPI